MPFPVGAGEVLAAMITPAVLISASGTLVLSTSNRLGRVVDRIRKLATLAEELPDVSAEPEVIEKRVLIAEQIDYLTKRLRLLQSAVSCQHTMIGLFVDQASPDRAVDIGRRDAGVGADRVRVARRIGPPVQRQCAGARVALGGKGHDAELDHVRKVVEH